MQWEAAIDLLWSQSRIGADLNCASYAACISACANAGEWVPACQILEDLLASKAKLDAFPFSAAIAACSRQWEVATSILEEMPLHRVTKDSVCYTAAISTCANSNEWRIALELLRKMLAEDLQANAFTYSAAMNACELTGHWEEALDLLHDMQHRKVLEDGMHVGAVTGAVLRRLGRAAAVDCLTAICGDSAESRGDTRSVNVKLELCGVKVICNADGLVAVSKPSGVLTEDVLLD